MISFVCSFISGLFTALAGAERSFSVLSFFAPTLFAFVCGKSPERSLPNSFFYGFALWGGSCLWIFELYFNGYLPSFCLTFFALFALSVIGGLIFTVGFLPFYFLSKIGAPFLFSFTFSYLLSEFIPSAMGRFSFPWTSLATSVSCFPPFLQTASVGGSLSVSFTVIVINGLFALALTEIKNKKRFFFYCSFAAAVFFSNLSFGFFRMSQPLSGEKISVAVVQGNLAADGKWTTDKTDTIFLYSELCRLICKKNEPSLIILPETSYPWTDDSLAVSAFSSLSKKIDSCVVFGCFEEENGQIFNSARVSLPDGSILGSYRKRRLVPFGEYDPFGILPSDLVGNISFGNKAGVIKTSVCNIGFLICFESLFSSLDRQNSFDGADITVIMTNDSWFGESSALYRHMSHAILRAVESGRSVVCSANTGISCVISNMGEITASVPNSTTAVFCSETEKITDGTLYSSVGDVIIFAALYLLLQFEFFLESVYTSACID